MCMAKKVDGVWRPCDNFKRALECARGDYQKDLVYGAPILSELRGRAKEWSARYSQSARNLMRRLDQAGVSYRLEYGPRGGWHSARIIVD
jgi:hypothetical protein